MLLKNARNKKLKDTKQKINRKYPNEITKFFSLMHIILQDEKFEKIGKKSNLATKGKNLLNDDLICTKCNSTTMFNTNKNYYRCKNIHGSS